MKILNITIKNRVNCSLNVCLWNHFDHDHINHVHKGSYKSTEIFYEDDSTILAYHKMPLLLLPFIKVNTIDLTILKNKNTILTYGFQLGIPSLTTANYKEISKDKCLVKINYKFQLIGLKILLYPIIKFLIPRWSKITWNEDLTVKLRRQKIKRMNFKDFHGLPKKIRDRKFTGEIDLKLPIKRLNMVDGVLKNHPFYNFKNKNR